MKRTIIFALLLVPRFAQAADAPPDMATVHEITEQDRQFAQSQCATERARYSWLLNESKTTAQRNSKGMELMVNGARGALESCQRQAAAWLEDVRVHGTPAEREQREKREKETQAAALEAAQAKAQAEADALTEKMKSDRKIMSAVFGLALCQQQAARATALAEISKEKKYSRIGGVESMRKLYELQQDVRSADEATAQIRAFLRTYEGVRPKACASREVKALLACTGDEDLPATCTADAKTTWMVGFAADLARKDE
jgi:hypothetical protein